MVCIFGQAFSDLLKQTGIKEIGVGFGPQSVERIAAIIFREVSDDLLFIPLVPLLSILFEQLLTHLLIVSILKRSLMTHLKMKSLSRTKIAMDWKTGEIRYSRVAIERSFRSSSIT